MVMLPCTKAIVLNEKPFLSMKVYIISVFCIIYFGKLLFSYFDGKHSQPFVVSDNFKFIISSTVDRILKIYDSPDTCKDEDWSGIDDDFE